MVVMVVFKSRKQAMKIDLLKVKEMTRKMRRCILMDEGDKEVQLGGE